MTIYLDVILLENLCMNYIILFATGLVLKGEISKWRLGASSILGAIYAVVSILPILEIYSSIFFKILISLVMVYIAFKPKNLKILLKQLLLFYLVSFAFGGCAFALLYFVKPENILMRNGVLTGTYPLKIALLGGIVGFAIVTIAFKLVKGKLTKKDMFCELRIEIQKKATTIKAMIDTGNLLKDPISGLPVIVVEAHSLEEVIPYNILKQMNSILQGKEIVLEKEEEQEYLLKLRVIPFSSLGKQNGLLLGIKAQKVTVITQEREIVVTDSIIGIYDKSLTKNGLYTGLIGLDILERCEGKNEYFTNFKV